MPALTYEQLTEAQRNAIAAWWNKNDPDGYTYEYVDNTRLRSKVMPGKNRPTRIFATVGAVGSSMWNSK